MDERFRLVTTRVRVNDPGASPPGAPRVGLVEARLTYRFLPVGPRGEPEVQFSQGRRLLVCNHTDEGEGGRPGRIAEVYGLDVRLMSPSAYGPSGLRVANAFSDELTGRFAQGECQAEDIGPMDTGEGPAYGFCRKGPGGRNRWYMQWLDWPLREHAWLMGVRFPISARPAVIVSYKPLDTDTVFRLSLALTAPPSVEGLTR